MPLIRRRVKGGEITMAAESATATKGTRMPEATTTTFKPFIDHLSEGAELPSGFTTWGFKVVRHDLTTFQRQAGRFQWPHSGVVEDPNTRGTALCPSDEDGGMAIAKNLKGARDGQYGYGTILLIAYNQDDVVAEGQTKVRVSRCHVVSVLNPDDVFAGAAGCDLSHAELSGANLAGANLAGANLEHATFLGSNLQGAHFEGAKCAHASFNRANIQNADFSGADLTQVTGNLASARGARFGLADLSQSGWSGADLHGAQFDGANVSCAMFNRTNMIAVQGRPKNAGTAAVGNVVFRANREARTSHPFEAIKVPRGRQDIFDALTGAGVSAVWEDATSPSSPRSRF